MFEHKVPPPLLKHSLTSPSAVADVMVQKYVDGIPLARQENIWKRDGITLTRATLGNWVIETSQVWLKPLYRLIRQHLTGLDMRSCTNRNKGMLPWSTESSSFDISDFGRTGNTFFSRLIVKENNSE